ncbi:MAG: TonB-dependent receptor [Gemmatimonadaceae bacterium]
MFGGSKRWLGAQALSTASIEGIVVTATSERLGGATVTLTEAATGLARRTMTDQRGEFRFETVSVGVYRLETRRIAMVPFRLDSVVLHIGDQLRVRLEMADGPAQTLETVHIAAAGLRDAGSGGSASTILASEVRNLPLLNRDFVGLFSTASQAMGQGPQSVSGQHARFNAIRIDGATANDLFGIGVTPGASAGGRSISIEAVEEIGILVSPFDVREGGFSGGLINAVTRSGTNRRQAAAFTSYSRSEFVGGDSANVRVPSFTQMQYGVSAGGPIVRDRMHYFAVAEAQLRTAQFSGPKADVAGVGISSAVANRIAQTIRDGYGFNPGSPIEPQLQQPNANFFLKLTWRPSTHNAVDFTSSFADAYADALARTVINSPSDNGWQLSNSGSVRRSRTVSARAKVLSTRGRLTNDALAAFSTTTDNSDSNNRVPMFLVQADPGKYVAAGSAKGAQGTQTSQRSFELTDNVSWHQGAHTLTAGTQNLFVHIRDNLVSGAWGLWTFGSVDSLLLNKPSRYEVALPKNPSAPLADFSSALLSLYLQDRWRPAERLSLTVGARVDVPYMQSPAENAAFASNMALGNVHTDQFPSGNVVVSPRIAFAWDAGSARRSLIRGGVGGFASRPPLVYATGAFSSTGQEQSTLVCNAADGVPAVTTNITTLPSTCTTAARISKPAITYFDRNFRYPQAVKYVLGVDHDFDHALSLSLDASYTRGRNNLLLNDVNLVPMGISAEGRVMYGAINASGAAQPALRDARYGPVYRYDNVDGDRSRSVSVSLQRGWKGGGRLQSGYTWSRAYDVMSVAGTSPQFIFRNNPLEGTLAKRTRSVSARDIPNNFVLTAVAPVGSHTTAAIFYRIRSGTPYAFTVDGGDANADGAVRNDLFYVPRSSADITLADASQYPQIEQYINQQKCLRDQRGQMVRRNSCRNAPVSALDGRVSRKVWNRNRRGVEVSADLFNIPNLLNSNWGLVRENSNREDLPFIRIVGWDAAASRPRYSMAAVNGQVVFPPNNAIVADASRWRLQLGVRVEY